MSVKKFSGSKFYCCVDTVNDLDLADAEVAFVGRSNAGKSSLVNSICASGKLAKVAKTPGKTRTINVFSICDGKWIIDLPGYGFAKVAKSQKKTWPDMIEDYFTYRSSIKAIFVLVDAKVGPTTLDLQMLNWLIKTNHNFRLVVNKIDRVSKTKLEERRLNLATDLDIPEDHVFYHSASNGVGRAELQKCIISLLDL